MKKLKLLLAALSFASVVALPGLASADVNDFTVTSFEADETLSRQDPQGELHIVERIKVDFTDYNHGILRAIPDTYKNHSLQLHVNKITSDSGAATDYTTYGSNGNTVLKIGDPSRTITGPQEYTIDYTLHNVISFYDNHDELYWDVNGDQWQQTFNNVSVAVHLPSDLKQSSKPLCYVGSFGGTNQACTITREVNTITAATTEALTANQTLTYVASFDKGYFRLSKWYETLAEYAKPIGGVLVPLVLLGGGGLRYWWRRGRDAKGRGVIIPQYDAPDDMKPMAMGALMDFKVGTSDITAAIVNLAIQGYIKIIEKKNDRKLRKDTLSYTLKLVNADFSGLDDAERMLADRLFSNSSVGDELDVSASKNKLYSLVGKLQTKLQGDLTAGGYFADNSVKNLASRHSGLKVLGGIFILLLCFAFFGAYTIIGSVVGGLIAIVSLVAMDARTAKGTTAKEHALGLKLYLEVAEKERLKKLQGPDAAYAANSAEPVKTVELFEKLLPYAMVLGVEQQWAGQFASLYTSPPDWYSGNWTTFNAAYLASSLNSGIGTAVNSAFTAPSSSGSSGSGGGFSGGGGGGGGGGGW